MEHKTKNSTAVARKIVLKTFDRIYSVNPSEVSRLESDGSYTKVLLLSGKVIMVSRLIKEFEEMLSGNNFVRVHQSHLINMDHVFCYVKPDSNLIMKDDSVVPVASRKKETVLRFLDTSE